MRIELTPGNPSGFAVRSNPILATRHKAIAGGKGVICSFEKAFLKGAKCATSYMIITLLLKTIVISIVVMLQ